MNINFYKRLKNFGKWCIGGLGCFLRHPKVVALVLTVLGNILVWGGKLLIIALLSKIGVTLPVL
jgi:hypothetical protein